MSEKAVSLASTLGSVFLGLIFLSWWLLYNPVGAFEEKRPGLDNRPVTLSTDAPEADIGSYFAAFEGTPSALSGSWPRFRGPDYDNISKERIPLASSWGAEGPPVLWTVDLGEGHAGPAVSEGRVYLLDYDEEARADILRCFSLDDGREIWRRGYEIFIKRNHGMSRTIPAVSGGHVVTIGPKCHVMCVDAESGDFFWGLDLVREFGAEEPLWYTGQCPLIDGNEAVIAVGGEALLIGVDLETGRILWQTPNPESWKMSHSSVMPVTIHGKKLYLYCAVGGIAGVSAEEEDRGELVFYSNIWNHNVVAPSPIHLGDGRIFLTAGYGAGSKTIAVSEAWEVSALQTLKPEEGLATEQQTPIFYKGHLFAILPKDAGPQRNEMVCCSPDDTSRFLWSSGKTQRFGLGPYMVAEEKLYILSDDGVLSVAEAGPAAFRLLGQARILDGVDAWGPMALAGGRLLLRDSRHLVCVDLRERR
jgi:outer membrane protein assembly factor BamB